MTTTTDESREGKRPMRTLAIRLEDDLHQQVSTIAKLTGVTVTDLIREAIETHVSAVAASPELSARAEALLADIDREAQERREALSSLLAPKAAAPARKPKASSDQPTKGQGSSTNPA